MRYTTPSPPRTLIEKLKYFTGVNYSATESQIDITESPEMIDFSIDEMGAIDKRKGYKRIYQNPISTTGKMNGMYCYKKSNGTKKLLIAFNNSIFSQNLDGSQPVNLGYSITNGPVEFFTMNDKCYFLDSGTNYGIYDGTTITSVDLTNKQYIPKVAIAKLPSGGGTPFEQLNLLGTGFKDSFSCDGTSTVYYLSFKKLDSSKGVVINHNGNNITSGFTVDYAAGTITFTAAPAKGTDNMIVTAYLNRLDYDALSRELKITKCKYAALYGGENDTRVFFAGNPEYPNMVFRSGLYDSTYFPENQFIKIGSDDEAIVGFSKQYDILIVEKEFSKWSITYDYNGGNALFKVKPINDSVGTLAPRSIQIVLNNPVSLSQNGIYMLQGSNVRDERNVVLISDKVNNKLLKEPNLSSAISVDYKNKYMLCINEKVYVCDYSKDSFMWYMWSNIPANCFLEIDGELYFGSNKTGLVYKFDNGSSDDGVAIDCHYECKMMDLNAPDIYKNIENIILEFKPSPRTSAKVTVITDKKKKVYDINAYSLNFFNFATMDFSRLSFKPSIFPVQKKLKINKDNVTYMKIIVENDALNETLGLLGITIKYQMINEVR